MESKMDVKFKSVHILIALVLVLSGCGSSDKSAPLDTDGDGVADSTDIFPRDVSETTDTDGDDIGDNGDNCPAIANADQLNLDNDELGDVCDDDIDGDDVPNATDIFPRDIKESQDIDSDALGDNQDNCPSIANADQLNLDNDELGDVCDDDIDGDGAPNTTDIFPRDIKESADTDSDGLGDNQDLDNNSDQANAAQLSRLTEQGRVTKITPPQNTTSSNNNNTFGQHIKNAGDVNDDGFDDLLIGFESYNQNDVDYTGIVYLIFGRASGLPAEIDLANIVSSDLDHVTIVADATSTDNLKLGDYVSGLGDMNGDGIDDFVISASRTDSIAGVINVGEVYIVFGRTVWPQNQITVTQLKEQYAVGFIGQGENSILGEVVINAGDLNQDNKPDLIIIERGFSVTGVNSFEGRINIIFGSDYLKPPVNNQVSMTKVGDLDPSLHTVINGLGTLSTTGKSVQLIGDFNDDGYDDFSIGSPYFGSTEVSDSNAPGAVSIVYGRTTWPAQIDLINMTASDGLNIFGDGVIKRFGYAMTAGDFNNDQVPDLVMSPCNFCTNQADKVYMLWGGAGDWPASITSDQIETTYGNIITADPYRGLGESMGVLNDTSGDGRPELLLASKHGIRDDENFDQSGRLFKINSRDDWANLVLSYENLPEGVDLIGTNNLNRALTVGALGDYNQDGKQEMLFDLQTKTVGDDGEYFNQYDEAYIINGYQHLLQGD
jgi:hypothetical protein